MKNANPGVVRGQPVGDVTGPIRRRIVHHEDVVAQVSNPDDDALEVLLLIEGRQDDEDLGGRSLPLSEPAVDLHPRNRSRMTCLSMSSELRPGLTFVGAELRHTTGTSAIFTPCLRARYSTSGS